MPTKKERSKQRKEAKAASESQRREEQKKEALLAAIVASLRNDIGAGGNSSLPNNRFRAPFFSPLTAHIMNALNDSSHNLSTTELVQRGSEGATQQIVQYQYESVLSDTKKDELVSIMPTVLDFLKRCEDETFEDVMVNIGGGTISLNSGDLKSPSRWVKVIATITASVPSCYVQIIENIGPLVRCMCNDTKCLFFKSKKHWIESIVPFIGFISRMIIHNNNPMSSGIITKLLLVNGDLTKSFVQWGFWEKYRPDISEEICAEFDASIFEKIVELGRSVTQILVTDAVKPRDTNGRLTKERSEECTNRLDIIGTTPVINKDYDPSCMISYASGLIHLIKSTEGKVSIGSNDESHLPRKYFITIQQLIGYSDCVDKGVIIELIDLGTNFVSDCFSAEVLSETLSLAMVRKGTNTRRRQVNDTRTAFAIRAGLIEMCLNFVEKFGMHISFISGQERQSLFSRIEHLLNVVYTISLHHKSQKALCDSKKEIIRSWRSMQQSTHITNNVNNCQRLVNMVTHIKGSEKGLCCILDLNGSYCCRCNKALDRNTIKRCNGCNLLTYCSRSCQKEDWQNGHKLACCKSYTDEAIGVGQFQGRICPASVPEDERAAAKLEELEVNITMIQLKVFLECAELIVDLATSLKLPLYDLIVLFDLRTCPSGVRVTGYKEYYQNKPKEMKSFEGSRSLDNITCIYRSRLFNGELDETEWDDSEWRMQKSGSIVHSSTNDCIMQRLYPHEWLKKRVPLKMRPHEVITLFGSAPPTQTQAPLPFTFATEGRGTSSFDFGGSSDTSPTIFTTPVGNTLSLGTSAAVSTSGASSRRRAAKKSARRK